MAWIMDTYSMHARHTQTAVVTGKPIALGGPKGRAEATGRGCMIVIEQALRRLGLERSATRVVIQGFGNVGSMAAKLMARARFKIIFIIDLDGGVYNPPGLEISAPTQDTTKTASHDRLEAVMDIIFQDVVAYAERHSVNNRPAAYMLEVDRLARAIRPGGI